MDKSFTLFFNSFVDEETKNFLPKKQGVYTVRLSRKTEDNKIQLKLLFIGAASSLFDVVNDSNPVIAKIKKAIEGTDKYLTVAYALYNGTEDELKRIVTTMVFDNQPKLNVKDLGKFPYQATRVVVKGTRASGLKSESIVRP